MRVGVRVHAVNIYWFYYSSEEFSARIIKAPGDWLPSNADYDFQGHYHGPFNNIKDARKAANAKINSDVNEFTMMRLNINGPPEDLTKSPKRTTSEV